MTLNLCPPCLWDGILVMLCFWPLRCCWCAFGRCAATVLLLQMCCCCSGCSSKLKFETWDFGCVLNWWMDVMILHFKTCGMWNACDIATIHGDVDSFEFDSVCVEKIIWMQLYVLKYCIWAELCVAELYGLNCGMKKVWARLCGLLKHMGWKKYVLNCVGWKNYMGWIGVG